MIWRRVRTYNLLEPRSFAAFIRAEIARVRREAEEKAKKAGYRGPVAMPRSWTTHVFMDDKLVEVRIEMGRLPPHLQGMWSFYSVCYTVYLDGKLFAWVLGNYSPDDLYVRYADDEIWYPSKTLEVKPG